MSSPRRSPFLRRTHAPEGSGTFGTVAGCGRTVDGARRSPAQCVESNFTAQTVGGTTIYDPSFGSLPLSPAPPPGQPTPLTDSPTDQTDSNISGA
jgi:hypothetical protein